MRLRHGFRPGPHCRSSRRSPTRSDPNRLERAGHTYPHKTRHSASLAPQPRWGLPAAPHTNKLWLHDWPLHGTRNLFIL